MVVTVSTATHPLISCTVLPNKKPIEMCDMEIIRFARRPTISPTILLYIVISNCLPVTLKIH